MSWDFGRTGDNSCTARARAWTPRAGLLAARLLLRPFRRSGPTAALTSWAAGLLAFWLVNYPISWQVEDGVPLQYQVSIPLAVSLVLFIVIGFIKPEDTSERDLVIARVNGENPAPPAFEERGLGRSPSEAGN